MPGHSLLYYITDRTQFPGSEGERRQHLLVAIAEAARSRVDFIQLREKDLSARELQTLASEALRVIRKSSSADAGPATRLLINSRLDVCLAVGASGVHFRSDDISIAEDDLEVFETEHNSNCATVVMIDISHSMILYGEDRITPAKKVALALTELILTKYPKDSIDVLLFGDEAVEVPIGEIPYVKVGPYHTNTKAGLELAQRILRRRKHNNKQIFMITDGKPSALFENGQLYTNSFGLDMKIVNRTLEEADRCRRAGIPITTFMLATDPMLVNFVEQLSKINRGRAFYTSPDRLGEYILADYIRNRRKFVH